MMMTLLKYLCLSAFFINDRTGMHWQIMQCLSSLDYLVLSSDKLDTTE